MTFHHSLISAPASSEGCADRRMKCHVDSGLDKWYRRHTYVEPSVRDVLALIHLTHDSTGNSQSEDALDWADCLASFGTVFCCGALISHLSGGKELDPSLRPILFVFFPAFFICVVAILYATGGGLTCPKCRGNLGPVITRYSAFSVPPKLKHCPFCGLDFDSELNDISTQTNSPDPTF